MSNLLFFDLDGTIVDEKTGRIPESVKEVLMHAKNNGSKLFINTGRPLACVADYIRDPEIFDGIICGLGTNIMIDGKELLHHSLGNVESKRIASKAQECGVECVFEGKESIYLKDSYEFPHFKDISKYYLESGFTLKSYPCDEIVFDKFVTSSIGTDKFSDFIDSLKDYEIIDRGSSFYEVAPLGYSKATGIDFVCNYYSESLENCYAFGDSTNDLPMLTHVKHGVAMGNGSPIIFDKCEFVTTGMDENGILNAFKYYGIIE